VSAEFIREATQNGRRVVLLRCSDGIGATVVEAEVVPVGTETPITRGPYQFASAHEAFRFVQEAMLALQYLGCTVATL
jgi:hypothetical protein